MALKTRRHVLRSGATLLSIGAFGYAIKPISAQPVVAADDLKRALTFLRSHPCVDVHAHPGRSFMVGMQLDSELSKIIEPGGFEAQRISGMANSGVDAVFAAIVADVKVLGFSGEGIVSVRDFEEGEAFNDFQRQLARFKSVINETSVMQAFTANDIRQAHINQTPTFMLVSEGGDFIEDKLERIAFAYRQGIRSITPLHYRVNGFGDIQTAAPVHNGLTALGKQAIREMNQHGIVIDVSHASEATANGILDASSKPVMLSHSHIAGKIQSPRFVSLTLAQRVVQNGGLIGAWPAGIGATSLADFVERVIELIDAVGPKHVAIGTDMDANYRPVLTQYSDFIALTAGLMSRGLAEDDIAAVLGGNILRVLEQN
ncbi:MAG: hypothetical protein GXP16_16955, partial [Gammaproteobacteria bacterium]|nr:hypothetical protein [Gammaproteobacteria bacterium]